MGKVVERKMMKRKKKGRPSLLDLQKRNLQEQQQQEQLKYRKPKPNPSPITTSPFGRSTRRNPEPDVISPSADENTDASGEDDDDLNGKRREKELKVVLKLPSSLNSASLNSGSYASDSNVEEDAVATNHKKIKIGAIADGSANCEIGQAEKHASAANTLQGTQLDMGPSTPLPDKKLLLFILDSLQKKDTYGVFAEPVDPEELPDYHDVIEHSMDFGTVRKKLASGAYTNLEQFEKDIFLICSNAMQYNAPDTIYFRQARSIQELAKKHFENLRQDSDDNEPERKIVRRGRPPTKNFKKQMGRPSLEHAGSKVYSNATVIAGVENTPSSNYAVSKGPLPDRPDFSGRSLFGSRYSEAFSGWLAEEKIERNDENTGSMSKGDLLKHGKKQVVFDESRRNSYKQSCLSADAREPYVLSNFGVEKKHLIPVGIHAEYGYARSLTRFAAILGPVAWNVTSKKIGTSLPIGVKFGPGWVEENESVPQGSLLLPSAPTVQPSPSQSFSQLGNLTTDVKPGTVEIKGDATSENPERRKSWVKPIPSTYSAMDGQLNKPPISSAIPSSSPIVGGRSPEAVIERTDTGTEMNSHTGCNTMNISVGVRPGPPFHNNQNQTIGSGIKGFNGAYGLNLPAQMRKLIGSARPPGINPQCSRIVETASRTDTVFINPVTNCINSEDSKFLENRSTISSGSCLLDSGCDGSTAPRSGLHPESYSHGLSLLQKQELFPPDLNVKFHSHGSPTSGRVDSSQPDLVLQL